MNIPSAHTTLEACQMAARWARNASREMTGEISLSGTFTRADIGLVLTALYGESCGKFIPENLGLPSLQPALEKERGGDCSSIDHPFHRTLAISWANAQKSASHRTQSSIDWHKLEPIWAQSVGGWNMPHSESPQVQAS